MISTMQDKIKNALLSAVSVFFWILLWHIAAGLANNKLLFKIPTPIDTLKELAVCINNSSFWYAVGNSLIHIITGFIFAVVLGLICGLFSGSSQLFRIFSSPISRLIRSVPVAAFIVLAWLWIPTSAIPSFISFLMVFPIVWLQVENSLLGVDRKLIEMSQVMGMNRKGIILNIKLPALLPALRNSCVTGLGFAWKSGVAAEVICNPTGSIGALLSNAKSNIEYSRVFAIVITIVILSLILENIIKLLWREKRHDKI